MKVIGQVTLWNYNYGSVLQCYATQRLLRDRGFDCILLVRTEKPFLRLFFAGMDYLCGYMTYLRYPRYIADFRKLRASTRRKSSNILPTDNLEAISRFIEEHVKIEKHSYLALKRLSWSDSFLAFFSGSDQVWSGSWFVPNRMYFLRFAPKEKRVAWAPSFGVDKVAPYNVRTFRKYINDYRILSSRETNGAAIISELTGHPCTRILDPALQLLPEQWLDLCESTDAPAENYILMFFLNEPTEATLMAVVDLAAKMSCSILSFGYAHANIAIADNITRIIGGPIDFINAIRNARLVCSDSFHALIFSLTFHVPFYIFRRQYTHSFDQSDRLLSLLNLCGVRERFIENAIESLQEPNMDFSTIDAILTEERRLSAEFLDKTLEELTG